LTTIQNIVDILGNNIRANTIYDPNDYINQISENDINYNFQIMKPVDPIHSNPINVLIVVRNVPS